MEQLDYNSVIQVSCENLFAGGRYHHARGGMRGTPTSWRLKIKETTYRVYFSAKAYFILRHGERKSVSLEWLQSQLNQEGLSA